MIDETAPHARGLRHRDGIASERWEALRPLAFEASRRLCVYCWTRPARELDHLTYRTTDRRDLVGREGVADVVPTCSECHEWMSAARRTWARYTGFHHGRGLHGAFDGSKSAHARRWVLDFVGFALSLDDDDALIFALRDLGWQRVETFAGHEWVRYSLDLTGSIVYDLPDVTRTGNEPADYEQRVDDAARRFEALCSAQGFTAPLLTRRVATGRPSDRDDRRRPAGRSSARRTSRRQYGRTS